MKDAERYFRRGIAQLQLYPVGKTLAEMQAEYPGGELALMGTNENPLGASPRALTALREELARVHLYPDASALPLRRAMASRLGIGEDMILLANGADNVLTLVAAAFLNEGEEALMAAVTFSIYATTARIMGAKPVEVPLRGHTHDLPAMRRAVSERTKLVFLCNPNNPTWTIVRRGDLERFVRDLPARTLVILDEAYRDFVSDPEHADGLDFVRAGLPVLSVRTFSKLYGLAGLRIGYLLGAAELLAGVNRVREVFPVDRLAQAAALAALDDEEHCRRTLAANEAGKRYLVAELERLGAACVPSQTNFVFADLHRDSGELAAALAREGILIRPGRGWNMPSFARITVGTMEQNRRLVSALERLLAGGPGASETKTG